ncbi:MAG: sensor histidine kinase [Geothermobacteraceae bacterium]
MEIYPLIDRLLPFRLQTRLSLLVTALMVLLISLISALFSDSAELMLREQIGRRALQVAQSVSLNPEIRQGLLARNAERVQHMAEAIRIATGAEYVVVGDREGIRFSHPDPEKIGRHFVGGDLREALEQGKAYASEAVGTLGPSLRGIVPLKDERERVFGFVAVGYLLSDIDAMIRKRQLEIFGYSAIVLVLGVFGAGVIARGLKHATLGLEPQEIAALFHERNAIITAIREGIIAVDASGRVIFANHAARACLGDDLPDRFDADTAAGTCACPDLARALLSGEKRLDQEMVIAGRPMLVNVVPLGEGHAGAVASFRPKDEIDRLARELSHVQNYSELLRAQTHEYSNKLHTIAGLLQLGAQQEALELLTREASGYQQLVGNLASCVPDPVVAGLILGKYNRACELQITLEFSDQNSFADLPADLPREEIVTILGNLLDNAFEASLEGDEPRIVRLHLTDFGPDLIMEVEDSGPGIAPSVAETLFNHGVSTKPGTGRGTGLALVKNAVINLGGDITFGQGETGGALFTVILPKNRKERT